MAEGLGGPDAQDAGKIDAAADDRVAGENVPGQALACQGGGIYSALPRDDFAVDGDFFPRADYNDSADRHSIRRNTQGFAVFFQVGEIGTDVHKLRDASSGAADGVLLKQRTGFIKNHNRHGFGIITQGDSANCGHGHEEVFIKDFPAELPPGSPQKDVPARQEIGRNQESKAPRSGYGKQVTGGHDRGGENYAPEPAFQAALMAVGVAAGTAARLVTVPVMVMVVRRLVTVPMMIVAVGRAGLMQAASAAAVAVVVGMVIRGHVQPPPSAYSSRVRHPGNKRPFSPHAGI